VRADEKLTALLELEVHNQGAFFLAVRAQARYARKRSTGLRKKIRYPNLAYSICA